MCNRRLFYVQNPTANHAPVIVTVTSSVSVSLSTVRHSVYYIVSGQCLIEEPMSRVFIIKLLLCRQRLPTVSLKQRIIVNSLSDSAPLLSNSESAPLRSSPLGTASLRFSPLGSAPLLSAHFAWVLKVSFFYFGTSVLCQALENLILKSNYQCFFYRILSFCVVA